MPFTTHQFLEVFAQYNGAVFPFQVVLVLAALVSIRLASNDDMVSSKTVTTVLAFLWLWMGVVYHWLFFSAINGLALVFGVAFVLQAAILVYAGAVRSDLTFSRQSGVAPSIGMLLLVYALLIYPIFGMAIGHQYPYSATFGLPCPTTIFMFGLFLRSGRHIPFYVLPIPVIWSVIGFTAALSFSMWEDAGLLLAATVTSALWINSHVRQGYEVRPEFGLKGGVR